MFYRFISVYGTTKFNITGPVSFGSGSAGSSRSDSPSFANIFLCLTLTGKCINDDDRWWYMIVGDDRCW